MCFQFRKKVQAARSSLLATVIVHAGQIFNMPAAYFNRSESSIRASNPEIQRLVREENGKYGPCARMLFPQDEDQIMMQHMFLSKHIVTVSIGYLLVRSVANSLVDALADAVRPSIAWFVGYWHNDGPSPSWQEVECQPAHPRSPRSRLCIREFTCMLSIQ